jgi:hypothetical protein
MPADLGRHTPRQDRRASAFPELVPQSELDRLTKRRHGYSATTFASWASFVFHPRCWPVVLQILATLIMIALMVAAVY